MEEFNADLKLSMGTIRDILFWAYGQEHIKEDAAYLLLQNMYKEAEEENGITEG